MATELGGSAPGVSGHLKNIQKEERDRAPQDSVQGEADRMRASVQRAEEARAKAPPTIPWAAMSWG